MGLAEQIRAGASLSRDTITISATAVGSASFGSAYALLGISTDRVCRVRLYDNQDSRDDAGEIARPFGSTNISASIALIGDFIISGSGRQYVEPVVYSVADSFENPYTYYRISENAGSFPITLSVTRYLLEDNTIINTTGRRTLPSISYELPADGIVSGTITPCPRTFLLVSASTSTTTEPTRLRLYSKLDAIDNDGEKNRSFDQPVSASAFLIVDAILAGALTGDTANGFDGDVYAVLVDSNNKVYVGGTFTSYRGTTANRIIRLNPDGSKDTGFDNSTGFNNGVYALQLTGDGKLYVGGQFTDYKGTTANRIIRLNPDGSKDTDFDNSTGFNNLVYALQLTGDGKLYVGGQFTDYKGTTANRIIRLTPDGSKDTDFDNSTGFNNLVYALQLTGDGKLYAGGNFTSYKGTTANYIIRLNANGSKDTDFDNSTGFDDGVSALAIDSNDKLYAVGYFTSYKGTTANYIIRLNANGSKDTDFDNSTGFGSEVYSVIVDTNNKVYVGGAYNTYKGTTANFIIRLNSDGTKDTDFDNSTGFDDSVYALALDNGNKLYVGGRFTEYKGIPTNHIIRLTSTGAKDVEFVVGPSEIVDITYFSPKIIGANLNTMGTNLNVTRESNTLIEGNSEIYYILENLGTSTQQITASLYTYSLED
jgi:uncharacterized delta-60 repeat protein